MPATLTLRLPYLQHVRPAWLVGGVVLVTFGASVGLLGNTAAAGTPTVRPMYPTTQSPVEIIDVPNLSVAQVVKELPIGLRFNLLLMNGGVMSELSGTGPYTLFAPADNYFDYLPAGSYIGLNKTELTSLAKNHIIAGSELTLDQALSDTYIILKAYKAKNGVVYVVNRVLIPDDLKTKLQ